ncbi:SDR family oxidoreductase [Streptomyces sp. TRM66268-LWL]|uniref:SDR family oxidoreductase n=1 Tax=Streptomyces polyasparticus TaxID=2767826 RepID=A0ABR7STX9_9ACTN|nr:SDR family oxidoreductase [Streptomyces polyasparticus]MBC9718001.1 SDR family oxidoreductase [Streptomyces polyasparticus]
MSRPLGIVVVGAGSGFGAALAQDLAASGHRVLAGSRRARPANLPAPYARVDVTLAESVTRFAEEAHELLGQIDGLVYCAADPGAVARAWEVDPQDASRVLEVSLLGLVRIAGAFVPALRQAGRGSIVTVGSQAARTPIDLLAVYGAAKAAAEAYTRSLAQELHGTGVRANVIGIAAETDLARTHRTVKAELRGRPSPHPPLPPVNDSLPLARWLLTDDARHVTGQTIEARQP